MSRRLPHIALLIATLLAWWISDHEITPWIARLAGYDRIQDKDLSVLLGHWAFGQLPRLLTCLGVWLVGSRLGLMPSLRHSLASGGSWRRVVVTGLIATGILLVLTIGIGAAAGGTFGFHPYFPKMAGDLVSNLYEEIVYRGLMFSAFYGVAGGVLYAWVAARTLWAPWIPHTLGDAIVDSILKLGPRARGPEWRRLSRQSAADAG